MKTKSSYLADIPRILNNSLQDNLDWGMECINDTLRYLTTKYYFNERSYTTTTVAQQQYYNLPPQALKLINVSLTIGGVKWQPAEVQNRTSWDNLNTITVYNDFPNSFFVWNNQVGIYPIPSSSGNTIILNYKTRLSDLSMADVTQTTASSTMTATSGTTTITASSTTFKQWMAGNWVILPHSSTDAANGDNQWYQIDSVTNGTTAILKNPYSGDNVSGANFTIGEVPILPEDYQDLPLYRMGEIYYTTRFPDPSKAELYQNLYNKGLAILDEEFGSKTTSVVIPDAIVPQINPNLFQNRIS